MAEKKLRPILLSFRDFLSASWSSLPGCILDKDDGNEPINDWLQANWEILVEYPLGPPLRLQVYGDGADCNGSSSRVFAPNDRPTYGIFIDEEFLFHSFGRLKNQWFEQLPPFDYVKGESKSNKDYWVKIADAKFSLKEVVY